MPDAPLRPERPVAYFCTEFGLDASIPLYSGGLGVLAGDHLKSASDLGLPLVGVGLLYAQGYGRQRIDTAGRQRESYPAVRSEDVGALPALDGSGAPVEVEVDLDGEAVRACVMRLEVGRVPLLLLDTGLPGNSPAARAVTDVLYGGDREHRIRQELLLGIGGVRALAALGIEPAVVHMNEGHSAFLVLERARMLVAAGARPWEALARARAGTVFTTHTPVPAGNEVFDVELARRYLRAPAAAIGLEIDELLALGRGPEPGADGFGLTPLALRTAARANGVAALHGEVARTMWAGLRPVRDLAPAPIGHVTNGVHAPTWLGPGLRALLERAGGRPGDPEDEGFAAARTLPARELWAAHCAARGRLVEVANARGVAGAGGPRLDPEALTIGFARRFATYKRAGLVFSNPERLARLLGDAERPLQIVIAGKAHPADVPGKALIALVTRMARDPRMAGRVVFVPDYDMDLGALITQGADVWLNTPRRPMEASGTSGMKAALNGGLNCSILDGWWAEGFTPEIGWAIDGGGGSDPDARDAADMRALYALLEQEVVPRFYDRDADGLPSAWVEMMRASIATAGERFSSHRMVREYTEQMYAASARSA